jgi:hypothetical protein
VRGPPPRHPAPRSQARERDADFSAHVGEPILPEQKQHLEDTAAYLVRNPLSLEWLARLSDHIPDPGQHRTLFYGEYSNRVRGSGLSSEPEVQAGEEQPPRKRRSPSALAAASA